MCLLPSISIVVPTYNEDKRIVQCLSSIFAQRYPRNLMEVFVVDDYSIDDTVKKAREFDVHVLYSGNHDAEVSKKIAFHQASGELFAYMDADFELPDETWLSKMVHPLVDDPTIVGSFTRYFPRRSDNAVNRFISYDPLQRDPIYQFFSIDVGKTIIEERDGYSVCQYSIDRIPPAGTCVFRKKALDPIVSGMRRYMDLDVIVLLVKDSHNRFAYVPTAGIYHSHITSLRDLGCKRIRNLNEKYLTDVETREYRWFDLDSTGGLLKVVWWVIYANLFFPELLKGIYESIKYKDSACLYRPVVAFYLTNVIVLGFLRSDLGRNMIVRRGLSIIKGREGST